MKTIRGHKGIQGRERMAIDLSRLTPEPWQDGASGNCNVVHFDGDDVRPVASVRGTTDRAFVLLARAAFGVMMRRGWQPRRDYYATDESRWFVVDEFGNLVCHILRSDQPFTAADPFTCLVEADRWFTEQEAKT